MNKDEDTGTTPRVQVTSYDPKTEQIELKISWEDLAVLSGIANWVINAYGEDSPNFWETVIGGGLKNAEEILESVGQVFDSIRDR